MRWAAWLSGHGSSTLTNLRYIWIWVFGRFSRWGSRWVNPDPLLELAREELGDGVTHWFIFRLMVFTVLGNIAVCGGCISLLVGLHRSGSGGVYLVCWWCLVAHATMQLIIAAVCLHLLLRIGEVRSRGALVECVASRTSSPAWRARQAAMWIIMILFPLLVLQLQGTVTVVAPKCISLRKLTMVLLSISTLWAASPPVMTRLALSDPTLMVASKPQGATATQILAIPLVHVASEEVCCAVCLADFVDAKLARRLPCSHHFHPRCIDTWLERNKHCPLCRRAVDDQIHANN